MTLLLAFFRDARTLALATLIVCDLVTGLIAALRTGTFDVQQIGNFYRTNVVPYILGYLLIYGVSILGVGPLMGPLWGEITATLGTGPAVLNLAGSIARNLAAVRSSTPPPPTKPVRSHHTTRHVAPVVDAAPKDGA